MAIKTGSAQSTRVRAAANRLRMAQIHCAEAAPDVRRKSLNAELDEIVKTLDPTEKRAFLELLAEEFPAWEARDTQVPVVASSFDEQQLKDPDFLVECLKRLAPALPNEKKVLIAREMARVGMSLVGTPDWPQATADEVRQKTGMNPTEAIDPGRALDLLALLVEFGLHTEETAWVTWRDMDGSGSAVKQPDALKSLFRKCLAADPNSPRPLVAKSTDRLKKLLGCFINVIPRSGQYSRESVQKVSPDEIRKGLELRGELPFMNKERALWNDYQEKFKSIDDESHETAIKKKMADQIRKWMQ